LQAPPLQPAALTHQLRIDLGRCGGSDAVAVSQTATAQTPAALLASAAAYVDTTRTGWLSGGLDRDGIPSAAVYRLTQACGQP
jgi:hypothetical protein